MSTNPEKEFVSRGLEGYEGMKVEEYTFASLVNYHGENEDYKLDVISPEKEYDSKRPAFVFIHGGGFVQGNDKRQRYVPVFAKVLTELGCVVVSPDYLVYDSSEQRDSSGDFVRGAGKAAEAVLIAVEYIKENAEKFNIDPERIAIGGGSAGGMTAFYLLEHLSKNFKMFLNCWGAPKPYVPDVKGFPPTLSIHGTADQAVGFELEAPIQNALEKEGIDHLLIAIEGAPHTPIAFKDQYMPTLIEWVKKYLL